MARDHESIRRIGYGQDNRPSLVRGEPFARRRRPFHNGILSAEPPNQTPASTRRERSQGNNLGGWRSNLEVFASPEASSGADDDTTPESHHDGGFMQNLGHGIHASGERRNATCDTLLGRQFSAWQSSDDDEDVEMMDGVEEPGGASDRLPGASSQAGRALRQSDEIERSNLSHRRRKTEEMTADDEVQDEPGSVGALMNEQAPRKRSRQY